MQNSFQADDFSIRIIQMIDGANYSIRMVMAWFTDASLLKALCNKASAGVEVELLLLNHELNRERGINFGKLEDAGGKIWRVSNTVGYEDHLLKEFCILDRYYVIHDLGPSTTHTQAARQMAPRISESKELADQYLGNFEDLKRKFLGQSGKQTAADYGNLCTRLITLREVVRTGDMEDIAYLSGKLEKYVRHFVDPNLQIIHNIIASASNREYSKIIVLIDRFLSSFASVAVYADPEIAALRLELSVLEMEISNLVSERRGIEKTIYEFRVYRERELGPLLKKLFELRTEKLKEEAIINPGREQAYSRARQEYDNYRKMADDLEEDQHIKLSETEERELKYKYRKACKLCHPDTLDERFKAQAAVIFHDLNEAYNHSDLARIESILKDLENGKFRSQSETLAEKGTMLRKVTELKNLRNKEQQLLQNLRNDAMYLQIMRISNWAEYFGSLRNDLLRELKKLESETIRIEK